MDWSSIIGLVGAVLTCIAAVSLIRNESTKSKLKKLQEFANNIIMWRYIDTCVFVLGPRSAGKSSVITAWTSFWKEIRGMPPTPVDFVEHQYEFDGYHEKIEFEQSMGIHIQYRTHARAIIYDYAGEDSALDSAIEKLERTGKYLLVFVLTCEPGRERLNIEYFNTNFLKKMQRAINASDRGAISTFVLFNKHDLIDHPSKEDDAILAHCRAKYAAALDNIGQVFGAPESFVVSAETGFGHARFLRALSKHIVDSEGMPKNA